MWKFLIDKDGEYMSRSLNHGFEDKCSEETFNEIYNMAFARGENKGIDKGYNKAVDDCIKILDSKESKYHDVLNDRYDMIEHLRELKR